MRCTYASTVRSPLKPPIRGGEDRDKSRGGWQPFRAATAAWIGTNPPRAALPLASPTGMRHRGAGASVALSGGIRARPRRFRFSVWDHRSRDRRSISSPAPIPASSAEDLGRG